MEVQFPKEELGVALERLNAAASLLERAAERFDGIGLQASLEDLSCRGNRREQELERRLAEAEATIESLRCEAARPAGRKTSPAGPAALVARERVAAEADALDQALRSLSIEQRIAVKSEMLRAGLAG